MEAGFIELLSVLLSLSGFGVPANPNAPSAAEVMKYAPASADYALYVDLEAVVPHNYQVLTSLPGQAALKANRQARHAIEDVVKQAEAGRTMIKQLTGIDPITDIKSVAMWVTLADAGDPAALVVVRGNFPSNMLDAIAATAGGAVKKMAGGTTLAAPDGREMAGLTRDGTLLFGTTSEVEARLGRKWRTPRARAGSTRARFAAMLDDKPFAAIASSPGKSALRLIAREIDDPDAAFVRDLMSSHVFAALALHHDGVAWTWTDRTTAGYERAVMASEGLIEMFRAAHFGTRGMVRLVLAGMASYRSQVPEIDVILRHQDQILKLVTELTGDGRFQARITPDSPKRTVTVRAQGKSLSEVVPVVGVLPVLGAATFLLVAREEKTDMQRAKAAATKPRAVKRAKPAKRAH